MARGASREPRFITGAVDPRGYPPPGPPEIAFAGRSNVGKSSLINALLRRRKLVRVSSTPGHTRQINFFAIEGDRLRFVDLPGYGFAKVPRRVKAGWRRMVEDYLTRRQSLAGVVVIIDIRRDPGAEDFMLLDFLRAHHIPVVIAVTKADKLSGNRRAVRLARLRPALEPFDPRFVPFSAVSGLGRDQLWGRLRELAAQARGR